MKICAVNAASDSEPLKKSCPYFETGSYFDNEATVGFSVLMSLWTMLFVEFWKRRSIFFAVKWNVRDVLEQEPLRAQYISKRFAAKKAAYLLINSMNEKKKKKIMNLARSESTIEDINRTYAEGEAEEVEKKRQYSKTHFVPRLDPVTEMQKFDFDPDVRLRRRVIGFAVLFFMISAVVFAVIFAIWFRAKLLSDE